MIGPGGGGGGGMVILVVVSIIVNENLEVSVFARAQLVSIGVFPNSCTCC